MPETVHILLVDDDPAENLILRAVVKKISAISVELHYCETIEDALDYIRSDRPVSLVLMDNRLQPQYDFRETVPALRRQGFIGPIGVISSSLQDSYFQSFQEYGADFRIDKAEVDPTVIEFIIQEYVTKTPLDPVDL
ncbi:response regulator [Pararhizobium sp.]|uniref:response regulator n=1 Tax=Pararhizobium sp. TaxID=1977563 RepID=UPI00271ED006|nr:response regulator [Pararhizobium sp.]MDO9418310.1 response regulator [Pararhizobium sp.]